MPKNTSHHFSKRLLGDSSKKKVEDELIEIYENPDGTMPDMKHIEGRKHHRLGKAGLLLFLSCVFFAGIAWLGFFFFEPKSAFREDDVIVSFSGPEEVAPGEEVRYRIRYRNSQPIPLQSVAIQIRYPEG